MTSSTQNKLGEENQSASPRCSPQDKSSPSTPITVERLAAPGQSTITTKRQADTPSNYEEPTKRIRVAEGSTVSDTNKEGEDRDAEIRQLFDLGEGRPTINYDNLVRIGPEGHGAWWHCKIRGCPAVIPRAHTPEGRAVIKQHIKEHCFTLRPDNSNLEEIPLARDNSRQFVLPTYSASSFYDRCADRTDRLILDRYKSLVKDREDIQKEKKKNFNDIYSALTELKHQRERDLLIGAERPTAKGAEGEYEANARSSEQESSNGEGKGKY
ncbi:hypothetical protein HOY82DRAFT_536659 [Tuber indicum]|nr:hypothetical protein HOY82DRAFT_536659 [Tuber indicum]